MKKCGVLKFVGNMIKHGVFMAGSYTVAKLTLSGIKALTKSIKVDYKPDYTDKDFDEEFPDETEKAADMIKKAVEGGCREAIKAQGLSEVAKDLTKED